MVKIIGENKNSTILVQKESNWKFYTNGLDNNPYRSRKLFFFKKDLKDRAMFNEDTNQFVENKRMWIFSNSNWLMNCWIYDLNWMENPPIFEDTFKIIDFNKNEHRVSLESLSTKEQISMSLTDFFPFIIGTDVIKWTFSWIFTFIQKGGDLQIQPFNI